MEATKVGSTTNKKKARAVKEKEQPQYQVRTKGYQETFRNHVDAKGQYDLLKKRSVKNHESTKLELAEVNAAGTKKVLESVVIGQDFYKED